MVVLPAPFGPRKREDLAGADLEVDPAHRLDVVVALAQTARADDRIRHEVDVTVELDVAVLDPTVTSSRPSRSRRIRSATVTERWRPPVQPIAIVRWLLPSAT